jgi:hypothetical protein
MIRRFWIDGRFSWPFVAAVMLSSLLLLLADLAWRMLVISGGVLAALVVGVGIFAALSYIGLRLLAARRRCSS